MKIAVNIFFSLLHPILFMHFFIYVFYLFATKQCSLHIFFFGFNIVGLLRRFFAHIQHRHLHSCILIRAMYFVCLINLRFLFVVPCHGPHVSSFDIVITCYILITLYFNDVMCLCLTQLFGQSDLRVRIAMSKTTVRSI